MGLISWLFGKPKKKTNFIEPLKECLPANQNQVDQNETGCLTFFVDGLQNLEFTEVGMSVKLWIPKTDDPEKIYIYPRRDGPYGYLGFVPSKYTDIIISYLKNTLDYDAKIVELTDSTCKIDFRLISKEETAQRINKEKASLRKELTKAYNPKKPITLTITTNKINTVNAGDKLIMKFNDLESYLQDVSTQRGPYSCQWNIKFLDQNGKTIGVFDHDKSPIQKILKAHFNSYQFNVEVLDTFAHKDYSEEKKRSNWKGYPAKLLITPYKSST